MHKNHWREGLAFLHSNKLAEPTFRQTLITLINFRLESSILSTFFQVLVCCVEAHKLSRDAKLRHHIDYDPTDIWLLHFIFERLVLAPNPHPKKHANDKNGTTINQLINRRLRLFRSGQIQQLYEESNQIESLTPSEYAERPVSKQRSAQIAADNDNFKSAAARLTKDTPVLPITDNNIGILFGLHPASYALKLVSYVTNGRIGTRSSTKSPNVRNHRHFAIAPKNILTILRRLRRGKAPGPELDSLDIFIKLAGCYTRAHKRKQKCSIRLETLAEFFTILANGDVPPRIATILRTTYLVALSKDPTDQSKIRPLGIPSAIRRITAIATIHTYKQQFAKYLLPFNVAIGVNGGVDIVTNTFRLGVERYISRPERDGDTPTRALISLDIKNMFNAMSRQKLRQILERDFPELSPLADMLYKEAGHQMVRKADGTWVAIPVEEGFSKGCPFSPIFAAIVLNHILRKVHRDLMLKAVKRMADNNPHDDGMGGIAIIMAYVDDTNILIPLEDVEDFMESFDKNGGELGARLNLDKTKILTSTSNAQSIVTRLGNSCLTTERETAESLSRVFLKYIEERNGLRLLGVPIGSSEFCSEFIKSIMEKAVKNSQALIDGLDSDQTILQLFKTCTAHKMTHLFAADVLTSDFSDLPVSWNLWHSDMADAFTAMVENVLAKLTKRESVPSHSLLISSMSTNNGGLGIQHPCSTAIPAFVLSTRRVIQYATNGIWISNTLPPVQLPGSITCLYNEWKTSSATTFEYFRRYATDISEICVQDNSVDSFDTFMSTTSVDICHERIRAAAADRHKQLIEQEWEDKPESLHQLEDILEPRHSFALVDMSRLKPKNRQKNEHFGIMLCRKLRLALWPGERSPICFCGKSMDLFGDHVLSCRYHCKTAMSNATRNGLADISKRIYSLVHLTSTDACVDTETRRVVKALPNLRPFDFSVLLDPLRGETAWRTPLFQLGFDVTYIKSEPISTSKSRAARKTDINMRLQLGEKGKFQRRGKTDKATMISLTGDEIIGDILKQNMGLIPIAISPFGRTSSLYNRHMYGTDAMPCPEFDKKRINAPAAYRLASSLKTPWGVLKRANDLWRHEHPDTSYSGSYRAMTPESWFDHEFGLITSSAIASHILRAYNKNKSTPPVRCRVSKECHCEDKLESWEAPIAVDASLEDDCISMNSSDSALRPAESAVSPHS